MNYREHMKKGECLFSAILWTAVVVLQLCFFLNSGGFYHLNLKSTWFAIVLLAVEAVGLAIHWYRYLAYDKKKVVRDE